MESVNSVLHKADQIEISHLIQNEQPETNLFLCDSDKA